MQSAKAADKLVTGPDMQVIGVGQLYRTAYFPEIIGRSPSAYRSGCTDIHKHGRFYHAVNGGQPSPARPALLLQ